MVFLLIVPMLIIIAAVAFCVWYYLFYTNEINRRIRNHITDGKALLPPGAVVCIAVIGVVIFVPVSILIVLIIICG